MKECFKLWRKEGVESKAYMLSDLAGRREDLGFTQPVELVRLTPVEMLPLMYGSEDRRSRIFMDDGSVTREGEAVAQSVDGKINMKFNHDPEYERCVDLACAKCRWL